MEDGSFKFSNYDCIGFDLDNTIAKFKIGAMVEMEYKVLTQYLLKKGYLKKHLEVEIDYDAIQKGLILDTSRGNILKIASDGTILRATHGTKVLSDEEIKKNYDNSHWELTDILVKDPLEISTGPNSEKLRYFEDYFGIVLSLVFARCVDSVDELNNGLQEKYSVFEDIKEGIVDMFQVDHFKSSKAGYYSEMKSTPEKYYNKCSKKVTDWLKSLKSQGKVLFLITGSYIDFASFTASNTLGSDWKDYFDIIIAYAGKPGFFKSGREFVGLDGMTQTNPVKAANLELGGAYVHGNWTDLFKFLSKHSMKPNPKCLYIGDCIIQDVYTPYKYAHCDTVAICEELKIDQNVHPDEKVINSNFWGSYLKYKGADTFWNKVMKESASIIIPNLEYAAGLP